MIVLATSETARDEADDVRLAMGLLLGQAGDCHRGGDIVITITRDEARDLAGRLHLSVADAARRMAELAALVDAYHAEEEGR